MTRILCTTALLIVGFSCQLPAQPDRWQQRIRYNMQVDVDENRNLISGTQAIVYTNNSPDTLRRLFMHLYWNAFAPGTAMDEHSRLTEKLAVGYDKTRNEDILDFDKRFQMRVADLKPDEQGWCHVRSATSNNKPLQLVEHETILEIILDKPLLPRQSTTINTSFDAQIPKMCRRSGRDSKQDIRYSIAQWYPKMAEYDNEGWHADPYVAREFYGVWGDFDVTINIAADYKLGGTGILMNAAEIGWGYDADGTALKPAKGAKRKWRFAGNNIHDFAWAADPDYKHFSRKVSNNRVLHFIYKTDEAKWKAVADTMVMALPFMEKTFGAYPYPQYSFIHAGGGATEYPMCTLMNTASASTAAHEWMHSWYQMMMGTNENAYAWMDEGFTAYADSRVMAAVRKRQGFAHNASYDAYFRLVGSKWDEPMSTPANFFKTNLAYNSNSYRKGAVYLAQLGYLVGDSVLDKILMNYYQQWRFKHPNPNDFIRVAEKTSGLQLKWYHDLLLNTTKTIDYAIDSMWSTGTETLVRIEQLNDFPMPVEVMITLKDSSKQMHYVPLSLMYGAKHEEQPDSIGNTTYPAWKWPLRTYTIRTPAKLSEIVSVEIDPSLRLADVDRKNNKLTLKW
jgi:hypothetical protein